VARGRYLDSWPNRDGAWRIDERRHRNDILQMIPVPTTDQRSRFPFTVTFDGATIQ
jgi:hypothetical protein